MYYTTFFDTFPLQSEYDGGVGYSQESTITFGSLNDFLSMTRENGNPMLDKSNETQLDTECCSVNEYKDKSLPPDFLVEIPQRNVQAMLPEYEELGVVDCHTEPIVKKEETMSVDMVDASSAIFAGRIYVDEEVVFQPLPELGNVETMDFAADESLEVPLFSGSETVPRAVESDVSSFEDDDSSSSYDPSLAASDSDPTTKVEIVIPPISSMAMSEPSPVSSKLQAIESKPKVVKAKSTGRKRRHRVRKSHEPRADERIYVTPNESVDVCFGRGGRNNKLEGNLLYHQDKLKLQALYHSVSKQERTDVAQQLVDTVHARGGIFLKNDHVGWYIVSNHTARTKASQALRERYTPEQRAEKRLRYRENKKKAQNNKKTTNNPKDEQQ